MENDTELAKHIVENTFRYVSLFEEAIQDLLPETQVRVILFLINASLMMLAILWTWLFSNGNSAMQCVKRMIPANFQKFLFVDCNIFCFIFSTVNFYPAESMNPLSIRQIRGRSVGHLVKVRGMVTRMGNVKPLATVIGYSCDKCGHESFQEVILVVLKPFRLLLVFGLLSLLVQVKTVKRIKIRGF